MNWIFESLMIATFIYAIALGLGMHYIELTVNRKMWPEYCALIWIITFLGSCHILEPVI